MLAGDVPNKYVRSLQGRFLDLAEFHKYAHFFTNIPQVMKGKGSQIPTSQSQQRIRKTMG